MERSEQMLFRLLEHGTSAPMVVKEAEAQLQEAGFEKLSFGQSWKLGAKGI